jgi:trk system potassium uptake protein TrkA
VIGLGRFGSSVAKSLVRLGHDVLAVDTTDTEALRQIGAEQFHRAVVGIGTDIEASVLTVLGLSDLGIKEIWAKAISGKHAAILERVGATHVVRPEADMGKRVAHLVTGTMTDFIEFDDGFAIARTRTPQIACGKSLAESALRAKYGITVVGVKTRGQDFTYATPETSIVTSDELIVSGPTHKVESFCALS